MRLRTLLAVLSIVVFTGCGTAIQNQGAYSAATSNQVEFDRYVQQRTSTLLAMGVFKNASDAQAKAYSEASGRFGARPGDTATFHPWSSRNREQVDTAILDELARNR